MLSNSDFLQIDFFLKDCNTDKILFHTTVNYCKSSLNIVHFYTTKTLFFILFKIFFK